jgi:RimJ/RimL family protein N-acetyltransferase
MLPIATQRLLLRPLALEDARVVANLIGNWNVVRWLAMPPFPYTIADAESFIIDTLTRDLDQTGTVAAIAREHQLIGIIGVEPRESAPTLGFWLGEPYWGNGYMSEAAAALVGAFFATTNAFELQSGYLEGNLASTRIHAKLGFEETGRGLLHSRPNGREMPDIRVKLTQARYRTLNP